MLAGQQGHDLGLILLLGRDLAGEGGQAPLQGHAVTHAP